MTRRLRKTTLEDIARHAGVGMATVDRVLNERGGVSQQTTRRVLEAAKTAAKAAWSGGGQEL